MQQTIFETTYIRIGILRKDVADKLVHYTIEVSKILGRVTYKIGEMVATAQNYKANFK